MLSSPLTTGALKHIAVLKTFTPETSNTSEFHTHYIALVIELHQVATQIHHLEVPVDQILERLAGFRTRYVGQKKHIGGWKWDELPTEPGLSEAFAIFNYLNQFGLYPQRKAVGALEHISTLLELAGETMTMEFEEHYFALVFELHEVATVIPTLDHAVARVVDRLKDFRRDAEVDVGVDSGIVGDKSPTIAARPGDVVCKWEGNDLDLQTALEEDGCYGLQEERAKKERWRSSLPNYDAYN